MRTLRENFQRYKEKLFIIFLIRSRSVGKNEHFYTSLVPYLSLFLRIFLLYFQGCILFITKVSRTNNSTHIYNQASKVFVQPGLPRLPGLVT